MRLLERAEAGPHDWGRREAEARCVTIGQIVNDANGRQGRAIGLDDDGALVLEDAGGRWSVRSGAIAIGGEPDQSL